MNSVANIMRDSILPNTDARFANHACEPNAIITKLLYLVIIKPVRAGEEITFIYNDGDPSERWDDAWTFECKCNTPSCQGRIDRYVEGFCSICDSE